MTILLGVVIGIALGESIIVAALVVLRHHDRCEPDPTVPTRILKPEHPPTSQSGVSPGWDGRR